MIDRLSEVEALLDTNQHGEAEELLRRLLVMLSLEELHAHDTVVRTLIDRFWKKRRRTLVAQLENKLTQSVAPPPPPPPPPPDVDYLRSDLRKQLDRLRDSHIFQWTTHYRDTFVSLYQTGTAELSRFDQPELLLDAIFQEVFRHASHIYQKGFHHVTQRLNLSRTDALVKSEGGLQGFLAVPVKLYSELAPDIQTAPTGSALRQVSSAVLSGILCGYGATDFAGQAGWSLLAAHRRTWLRYAALLTSDNAARLEESIVKYDQRLALDLATSIIPLLKVFDRLLALPHAQEFCLPVVSEYGPRPPRLEVSLQLPRWAERKRFLDVHCYLNTVADISVIQEALSRDVDLLAVPLRADVYDWWQAQDMPARIVLDTTQVAAAITEHQENIAQRAHSILHDRLLHNIGHRSGQALLAHNYPREFPLENPLRRRFFLVHRASVARLLQMFERSTGVRVWCSVRRSGKTTACRDLGSVSATSLVVNQTMHQETLEPDLNIFHDSLVRALEEGRQLPRDFFLGLVRNCALSMGGLPSDTGKLILVLDEYEILFARLRAAVKKDESLEFSVVHPLLNQMVSFSHDNLLIFLGQKPDAHHILMHHNQLSPLVRQDSFPLFDHVSDQESEFTQFIRRVISERATFDPRFADIVYHETGGHPYLTVNLMIDFFDWLIENNRRSASLNFTVRDFVAFRADRLATAALQRTSSYVFMQRLLSDGLSERTRATDPWLYAVINAIQRMAASHPKALSCSEPEFARMSLDLCEPLGWTVAELLRTGQMANFLRLKGGMVFPTIPLLARLAVTVRPDVN